MFSRAVLPRCRSSKPTVSYGQAEFVGQGSNYPKLCFQGQMYGRNGRREGLLLWRCTVRGCPGRLLATPMGMVVEVRPTHTHKPCQGRVEAAKLFDDMKDLALTVPRTVSAKEVFESCLAVCKSPRIRMFFPSAAVCQKKINNHRAMHVRCVVIV